MSLSNARSAVARVQKEIADLRSKDAQEAKKEADLTGKLARATSDARSTKSVSTLTSKLRDAERASKDLAAVQKKRADLAKQLSDKMTAMGRSQDTLSREEDRDRKRIAAEEKKLQDARQQQMRQLDQRLRQQREAVEALPPMTEHSELPAYDVFISHASEDKDSFVAPLAERLIEAGLDVWYDNATLKWGDSLRREIDKGLSRSKFGIVVLSENFFRKEWPQQELDGLVQLESMGRSRILPIWHKISKDEVATFSPTLADKVALNTAVLTVDEIVQQLIEVSGKGS